MERKELKLDMDSRGFAISIDVLLALIPLTIVLGMVAADMDNIMYQMEDAIFRGSNDRAAVDAMNVLIKTPGTPTNWQQTGNPSVVGLVKYDPNTNTAYEGQLAPTKLYALNASHMQQLVGNKSFYLNVTLVDGNVFIKNVTNSPGGIPANATDVVRIQKVALCSQYEVVSSITGQIWYTGASRSYQAPTFQTSYNYNQSYDYWIFIQNKGFSSASVFIKGNTILVNTTGKTSIASQINSAFLNVSAANPNTFYDNIVQVTPTGSPGNYMDFYIVQTPKGVSASDINTNTVTNKNFRFQLYVWPT
jgi:hypothetical protein